MSKESSDLQKMAVFHNLLTQQISCGAQSSVFIVIGAMKHAWLGQYFTKILHMFVIYAQPFFTWVLWRGDRFREQFKSNGLSYGESSYENKREEIRGGSRLCFDLFNPAFEKTQALRAISHRLEEDVFHLLTLLMIHPEISRESFQRQVWELAYEIRQSSICSFQTLKAVHCLWETELMSTEAQAVAAPSTLSCLALLLSYTCDTEITTFTIHFSEFGEILQSI